MVEDDREAEGESASLAVGQRVQERYEIRDELGRGGFATVYSAFDSTIRRQVAIKVLHVDRLNKSDKQKQQVVDRFLREARVAARISHPAIIEIYDFGVLGDEERPYIIMELLDGEDLEQILEDDGPMAPARLIPLFCEVLEALEEIHRNGVVHKDLKPANLFWAERDTPRERLEVVDFGIAHVNAPGEERLTQTGTMTGTLQYLPPEYIEEQEISTGTDIYQMGLILVEALTGNPVVDETNLYRAGMAHVRRDFNIPEAIVDSPLGPIIECSLAADPDDRYESAALFCEALADIDDAALRRLGHQLGSAADEDVDAEDQTDGAGDDEGGTEKVFYDAIAEVDADGGPKKPVSRITVQPDTRPPKRVKGTKRKWQHSASATGGRPPERQDDTPLPSSGPKTAPAGEAGEPPTEDRMQLVAVVAAFAAVILGAGVLVVIVAHEVIDESDEASDGAVVEGGQQVARTVETQDGASRSGPSESSSSDDEQEDDDDAIDAKPAPEEAQKVTTLTTDPPGAEVVTDGGESLGITPVTLERHVDETLRIEITHAGYHTAEVVIDENSDEKMEVALEVETGSETGAESPTVTEESPPPPREATRPSPSDDSPDDSSEEPPETDDEDSAPALQLAQ